MKKVNSQILLAGSLFILLVVLCFSWVSTEMFQNSPLLSTSVASNNNNMNRVVNLSNAVDQHNVVSVPGSPYTKASPDGYNGLTYFQDYTKHVNSTNLPRQ